MARNDGSLSSEDWYILRTVFIRGGRSALALVKWAADQDLYLPPTVWEEIDRWVAADRAAGLAPTTPAPDQRG